MNHIEALDALRNLKDNWNSYNAPAIDSESIEAAKKVVRVLEQAAIPIDCVGPTSDGGAMIRLIVDGDAIDLHVEVP